MQENCKIELCSIQSVRVGPDMMCKGLGALQRHGSQDLVALWSPADTTCPTPSWLGELTGTRLVGRDGPRTWSCSLLMSLSDGAPAAPPASGAPSPPDCLPFRLLGGPDLPTAGRLGEIFLVLCLRRTKKCSSHPRSIPGNCDCDLLRKKYLCTWMS